ncbi:secretin N-terminal domain-containing protein [Pontiella sp.]|uniref:secretin N-terminal domain-containing protein n=1 Tax=Pontiella sp. TaxID=2837462 RepID=UPI003568D058
MFGILVLGLGMGSSAQDRGGRSNGGSSSGGGGSRPSGGMTGMRPGGMTQGSGTSGIVATDQATRDAAIMSGRTAGTGADSDIAVNWENITLKDCIEVLCRDLEMEFIISPSVNVSQEVSIRAGDVTKWEREDKLEMFDAILETAGVQRIARGRVWVFSPSDLRPIVEADKDSEYPDGKPIIGVIRLKNIGATTAQTFLNNFSGKTKNVFGMESSGVLIVLGTQAYLDQMYNLLKIVDVPSTVMVQHVLKVADASDVAEELTNVFYRRTGYDGSAVQFFAIARLNMVVAHNATESLAEEIERWIAMLDRTEGQNERVTKIYRLKVVEAETIGNTLDELYSTLYQQTLDVQQEMGKSATKQTTGKNDAANASNQGNKKTDAAATAAQSTAKTATASAAGGSDAAGTGTVGTAVNEEVIVLSDEDTNTLIVNAPANMHKQIKATIEELDRSRRQVLIETVLVEVTLDESLDLGIEWAVIGDGDPSHSGSMLSSIGLDSLTTGGDSMTAAPDGLTYLMNANDKSMALIHAAEEDDRLQVLSSPTVLTRDGMEAEISFGEEVPIQQSTVTDGGNENFSYDYRDAKITLTVTPKIDDNRMVTLDLEQTLRSINPDTIDDEAPKFYTRELRSNLQVADGQTIILGGLIQRNDQKVHSGIPLLCKIPYIGWIFGRTKTAKVGSEILMILTPHVVETRDETDSLSREFQQKILGAMDEKDIRTIFNLKEEPLEKPVRPDASGEAADAEPVDAEAE